MNHVQQTEIIMITTIFHTKLTLSLFWHFEKSFDMKFRLWIITISIFHHFCSHSRLSMVFFFAHICFMNHPKWKQYFASFPLVQHENGVEQRERHREEREREMEFCYDAERTLLKSKCHNVRASTEHSTRKTNAKNFFPNTHTHTEFEMCVYRTYFRLLTFIGRIF